MGDLTDKQAAQSVKLVGADSSGVETNFLVIDSNGFITVNRNWTLVSGTDSVAAVQSGTWNITDISGTISLPTGASTSGLQTTANTSLSSIDTKLTTTNASLATIDAGIPAALGQTTMSASMPVTLASNQSDINIRLKDGAGTAITSTLINSKQRLDVNLASAGPVTPGTVADLSNLVGAQYNTVLPTLTNGQQAAMQFDSRGRLIVSTFANTAAFSVFNQNAINAGSTLYTVFNITQSIGLTEFYAGGTGIGKQSIAKYVAATNAFVNAGDFETPADINTTWLWASTSGTGSIASSTTQFNTGARSVALTFSNSSGNNAQGVKQTFSSVIDVSSWRYITAQFYNTLSAGGNYTRTISIILTDSSASTRTYSVSGSSTVAPFLNSGWIGITGELETPTSSTGTSFDPTSIVSLELRMADSANKSGLVYWDTVKLIGALNPILPIYHLANSTFTTPIDPAYQVVNGDVVILAQKNNDLARKEFFAFIGGVTS